MEIKNKDKEYVISALNSPEGRSALATAMVAPINSTIMYQNIGRQILTVDELPLPDLYPNALYDVSDYMKNWVQK